MNARPYAHEAAPNARMRRKLKLTDLTEHPLIAPVKGTNTRKVLDGALSKAGITPEIIMELSSTEAAKKYVQIGMGMTLLASYYLPEMGSKGLKGCKTIDVSHLLGKVNRSLIVRKGRAQLKPLVKALKEPI